MRHTFASAFGLTTALLTGLSFAVLGILANENVRDKEEIARLEKELRDEKALSNHLASKIQH